MRSIAIERLTPESFAPFGEVLAPPAAAGRAYFDRALATHREAARPSLSLSRVEVAASLPVEARRMERHRFSSQSFVPMGDFAMLIIVAPHSVKSGPDVSAARAFVAEGGVGVTYGADVWHHPLTLLSAPATLAVLMWRDGGPDDEEFVDIEPFLVRDDRHG